MRLHSQKKKVARWVYRSAVRYSSVPRRLPFTVAVPRYLEVPIFLKSQQVWKYNKVGRRQEGGLTQPNSHHQKKVGLWVGTVVPLGTRAHASASTTVAVPRYLEVPIFLKSQQVWKYNKVLE